MSPFIKVSSLVFLSIMFLGCSSDDDATQEVKSKVATSTGIEVVANTNANSIKVEEKNSDTSDDKSYYFDYGVKSAYPKDAQPANSDASVRLKARSNIDANLHVRSPYEKVEVSMMLKGMSKNFMVKCSACHSDYANGVIGPSLLGKDTEYIYGKIMKFKKDKNLNILMSQLVENMSNEEIRSLAQEISEFNIELNKMRNK